MENRSFEHYYTIGFRMLKKGSLFTFFEIFKKLSNSFNFKRFIFGIRNHKLSRDNKLC